MTHHSKSINRFISVATALAMALMMVGCGSTKTAETVTTGSTDSTEAKVEETVVANNEENGENGEAKEVDTEGKTVKIGLICLHDSNSTYDLNFIEAFEAACAATGVECITKTNVPETNECYEAAVDLVDRGCNIVFADSFGHEAYIIQAAQEFPDVEFCHATGTRAHTEGLTNYHNAFAAIYEGRYLGGVVAGMKLKDMMEKDSSVQPIVGYPNAWPYAECLSGYTAFYLGVKSIVPEATMKVINTGSWYSVDLENNAANKLIADGCVIMSQHCDSTGAITACEEAGVPDVSYNGSTMSIAPNTYLISTKINWQPYFEYIIGCVKNGETIVTDWTGTIATGSVEMTELNTALVPEGTAEKLEEVKQKFINGELHVFDTSTFTVDGKEVTEYMADVDTDEAYTGDTQVISDGYFHESEYRSAPYFDLNVDGITVITGE